MNDEEIIFRNKCAALSDGQLIDLVIIRGNGMALQTEAILYDEFLKRGLDTTVFKAIHKPHFVQEEIGVNGLTGEDLRRYIHSLWTYVAKQQVAGASTESIKKGLQEKGLKNADEVYVLARLEELSLKLLSTHSSEGYVEIMGTFICLAVALLINVPVILFVFLLVVILLLYSKWVANRNSKAVLSYVADAGKEISVG